MLYIRCSRMFRIMNQIGDIPSASLETNPLLDHDLSWDVFRWGLSVVLTRQNYIPFLDSEGVESTAHVLVPVWDFMNHEEGELTTSFNPESDCLEYYAMKPFVEGDEVTMCYGHRSQEQLLLYSGFVTESASEYDSIKLRLVVPRDELFKVRFLILSKYAELDPASYYMDAGVFQYTTSYPQPLPWGALFASLGRGRDSYFPLQRSLPTTHSS